MSSHIEHCFSLLVQARCLHAVGSWTESLAPQKDGKSPAKVGIEGVYDGVERRIGPSEPDENIKCRWTDAGETSRSALAKWHHAVQDEEWQPAAHKNPHYDGQCF